MERQPSPLSEPPLPRCWLGRARAMATLTAGRWRFAGDADVVDEMVRALVAAPAVPAPASGRARVVTRPSRLAYEAGVRRVLQHIQEGDCYQVNLTRILELADVGEPFDLWRRLRRANPARRAVLVETDGGAVVSNSPELFLAVRGTRALTVPIKGTLPRTLLPGPLLRSPKERAELTMIVDLVRADLGRVARPGTVRAGPRRVGPVGHVWHALQRVSAELAPGRDAVDAFAALFPAGSVTGAPKVRAMEIIRDLEEQPRGVYCGAVGWFGRDGSAWWNVAIRTLSVQDGRAWMGVGSGIVYGSDPSREYEESELKAERMLAATGDR